MMQSVDIYRCSTDIENLLFFTIINQQCKNQIQTAIASESHVTDFDRTSAHTYVIVMQTLDDLILAVTCTQLISSLVNFRDQNFCSPNPTSTLRVEPEPNPNFCITNTSLLMICTRLQQFLNARLDYDLNFDVYILWHVSMCLTLV